MSGRSFCDVESTSCSECTAEQAYNSPRARHFRRAEARSLPWIIGERCSCPDKANNAYIFPGIGLGVTACRVRHVTDKMFWLPRKRWQTGVTEEDSQRKSLPALKEIRKVSLAIAKAVAEVAYTQKLAAKPRPGCLRDYLAGQMYQPIYEK